MKKVGLVLLLILLLIMFWNFDFSGFTFIIKQLPPLAFILLLCMQVVSQILVNYQWSRIAKAMNKKHGFIKFFYINARGAIIEAVTPGAKVGGEVTRALLLKKELKYSPGESATLVTIQKMISLFSFFIINIFAFASLSRKIESFQGIGTKAIVYFFLLVLVIFLVSFFAFTSKLENKIESINFKYKWAKVLQGYMIVLLKNIKIMKNIKGELYKQIVLSLIIWFLFPVKMILLVHFLNIGYDPIILMEVTFISYMVGMIPLLPGGLGSFEATMTSLFMVMEIKASDALAISLLFRFITFGLL